MSFKLVGYRLARVCPTCKGRRWIIQPPTYSKTNYNIYFDGEWVNTPVMTQDSHCKIPCPKCNGKGIIE